MNCTAKEFEDKVWAVYPQAILHAYQDDSNAHCIYHFLPEPDPALLNTWGSIGREINAAYIWREGTVIKDRYGLFFGAVAVGGISCGQATFTANTVLGGPPSNVVFGTLGSSSQPTFRPLLPSMLPGYKEKCECGAHSVGSNKHSGYCPIKENI